MRQNLRVMMLWLALFGLSVSQAIAFGFGAYVEGAVGSGEAEIDWDWGGKTEEFDTDLSSAGFGFVMDSNLAANRVFNYRLNVGFDRLDMEDEADTTLELGGLVVDNTFGFGIVRTRAFRLWLGPQVRFGFYGGETDNSGTKLDAAVFAFGLAPVLGANLNLGAHFTLSITTGYRFLGFAGPVEWSDDSDSGDLAGNGGMAFFNVSALFRSGSDTF